VLARAELLLSGRWLTEGSDIISSAFIFQTIPDKDYPRYAAGSAAPRKQAVVGLNMEGNIHNALAIRPKSPFVREEQDIVLSMLLARKAWFAAADHFAFGLMAIWILQSRRDSGSSSSF
jgi:hypothetical protein